MINFQAILEQLDKLKSLPWKASLWLLAGTFTVASLVSSLVGQLLMPDPAAFLRANPKVLAPAIERDRSTLDKSAIQKIIARNIFNIDGATGEEEKPADEEHVYRGDEAIESSLPLKLTGTIFGGDPFTGIALIEDTQKKSVNSFFVGDMLASDAKVIEIHREKVMIDRGDHREYLKLKEKEPALRRRQKNKGPAAPMSSAGKYAAEAPPEQYKEEGFERNGAAIVVSSDFRKKLLTTDFAKVLQDAKAEPQLINGELSGFRLTRIRQDSIYQKSGLQDGDVIKEINGVSLVDTAQAIKLLNSLRGESEIEVRLDRNGATLNINMQVR